MHMYVHAYTYLDVYVSVCIYMYMYVYIHVRLVIRDSGRGSDGHNVACRCHSPPQETRSDKKTEALLYGSKVAEQLMLEILRDLM